MSLQKTNTNPFEVDLEFARHYERKFAREYCGDLIHSDWDDKGVDVIMSNCITDDYNADISILFVDVKAYRCPLYRARFDGIFVEEYSGERKKNLGWYKKLLLGKVYTTDYVFYINCRQTGLGGYTYSECYHTTAEELLDAVENAQKDGTLQHVECKTAAGFILPYKYLKQYGREIYGG